MVSTALQVITSAMAAYAFARFEFRGKHLLFGVYLATLMIPLQVLIVPLFIEVSRLGLQDTYVALLLPLIASPFGVFLLRQFFLGLPPEIEEAARNNGLRVLNLDIRETQTRAIEVVEEAGFVRWGTHPHYAWVDDRWVTGFFYFKDLHGNGALPQDDSGR